MALGKYIAAGAGWFLAGPIGGIVGYYVGKSFFDGKNDHQKAYEVSLLILSSLVIKADGKVLKSELNYVRSFFNNTFGSEKTNEYFRIFNKLNKEDLNQNLRSICIQIKDNVNHAARVEIIHFLFNVSAADNEVHSSEVNLISKIAGYLNVNQYDFESIKAMFLHSKSENDIDYCYKILEIPTTSTLIEVKKAYRKMVIKYHPDKLVGVSDDIKKLAEEKFLAVKDAYEKIIKNRR
jgi:DnaJ like chaperone protein